MLVRLLRWYGARTSQCGVSCFRSFRGTVSSSRVLLSHFCTSTLSQVPRATSRPICNRVMSSITTTPGDDEVVVSGPGVVGTGSHPTGRVWQRLPNTVIPRHYELHLTPNLEKYEFYGTVEIIVDVKSEVSVVELNSADLVLEKASITSGNESTQSSTCIESSASEEISRITFPNKISVGSAKLHITFKGILNDQMKGFYRSAYKSARTGKDTIMAVTQFEATDARRAFPCWDEPALKATFGVTLCVPSDLTVVSNMPEIKRTSEHGIDTVTFDKSPIMSTYLLAFVVGEFDMIERKTEDGILVRCFTPVGKTEQGEFGLDVAVRVLPFYAKYFDIPYPLPKLDLLAIPDFAAGAMENWGCVTYRESALLIDKNDSSAQTKQWVALVVAHEIAHQWFGNIVTMEWWTHLWLNEGFATWMENFAVDYLFPEWNIWSQYVSSDMNQALSLDALKNSHPIEVEVNHPDEVDEIFDAISYSKGSVVIRMLHAYLGADIFRKGLQAYLKQYQYQNALTRDLWRVLSEQSGKPVEQFMDGWTRHTGFPLIRVLKQIQQRSSVTYELSQNRFFVNGIDQKDNTTWCVPISAVYPNAPSTPSEMLPTSTGTITISLPSSTIPPFIKFNVGQVGLFRVMYTPEGWKSLELAITKGELLATDRLGLQNDAFALTRAGEMSTVTLLQLVAAYKNETDYTVWSDLSHNLSDLGAVLKHASDPELYTLFQSFAQKLYKHMIDLVGWTHTPNENHLVTLLRSKILNQAVKYGDEATIAECLRRFIRYQTIQNDEERAALIAPDLRPTVYSAVASHGSLLGYKSLLALLASTTLQEERVRILHALGHTQDVKLLQRTLELAMSSTVRSQDVPGVILSVGRNLHGLSLGWSFLQQHWSTLISRFGGSFAMSQLASFPSEFVTMDVANQVENFFNTYPPPAGERAAKQAVEKVRSNAAWLSRDATAIKSWLQQHRSS